MRRGKGPRGMTAGQAVCQTIERLGRATGDKIFEETKGIYKWGNHTIYHYIMAQTINLWPGYHEWPGIRQEDKCLFLCSDGYFECYDQNRHGIFKDGIRI